MGRLPLLVLLGALWIAPRAALAQAASDQDKALAATLFDDARALLSQGKVPEACRKLEESRRLDPLPGTMLNLATCHEREGLTASAMVEFRGARAMAERDQRGDRVAFADEHLKALMPKLSMLVIVIPPEVDVPGLTVMRDGLTIGRAAWGTRIPVDPGTHVVEVSAPGKKMRQVEVRVGPQGDVQTTTLASLEDAPSEVAPVVSSPPATTSSPDVASTRAPIETKSAPAPHPGLSTRREWALVAAGVGVLGVGAGSFLGLRAIGDHHDPGAICTTSPCSSTSVSLNNDAKLSADVSTASFAVGLVAVGLAAFLWFGDSVTIAPGVGSVQVAGRF